MSDAPPPYPGINPNQNNPTPGFQAPNPNYPVPGYQAPGYQPPAQNNNYQAYPPQNPPSYQSQGFAGGSNMPTYPGAAAEAAANLAYPNLPSQPFGFNAPSAPSKKINFSYCVITIY